MSRRKYSDKEYDDLQRLKQENKKLKRQNAALRKQFQRVDLDRYENLKDIIHKYYKEDLDDKMAKEKKKLKKVWECHECRKGFLRISLLYRRDGLFYHRVCTECKHRTKAKPYTDGVEGITDEEDIN